MKIRYLLLVLVGVVVVAIVGVLYRRQGVKEVEQVLNRVETVKVVADGGQFTPSSFKVELFDTVKLNISAVDRDYTFKIRDYPRMDVSIPKGKTVMASVQYLGVGDYVFDCGPGCSGTINVVQERDTEGEELN